MQTSARFPGVRDPDFWMVEIDGDEEHQSRDTEAEANQLAAEERWRLIREWRENEGPNAPYNGPEVLVEPVWIGDPRVRRCRVCGCTDLDCRGCIEKTGVPCSWMPELETDEGPICSACV